MSRYGNGTNQTRPVNVAVCNGILKSKAAAKLASGSKHPINIINMCFLFIIGFLSGLEV
jgi:hypothetical protein